jgi:hypothetical protein
MANLQNKGTEKEKALLHAAALVLCGKHQERLRSD